LTSRLLYSEGAVFLVPLRDGGHARGVVARADAEGVVLFGYFFGPLLASNVTVPLDDLKPEVAALRVVFGPIGLRNGEWRILGQLPAWDRSKWPMPDFAMRPPGRKAHLVRYSDTDPTQVEAQYPIDDDGGLPSDSALGYGAVEIMLTKLLGGDQADTGNVGNKSSGL